MAACMSGGAPQIRQPGGRVRERIRAAEVAGPIVRSRLEAVWTVLRAVCDAGADPDGIHRLRVATRRAIIALKAFDELTPSGDSRWFRRRLRRVRRVSGEARDLDVMAARFGHVTKADADAKARRLLVSMLAQERPATLEPIAAMYERLREDDWSGRLERLVVRMDRDRERVLLSTYGRRRLKSLVRRFFAYADPWSLGDERIHRLRIEGKRVRYALEIFAPVLPRRVCTKVQRSLERLQDNLGSFTDHAAAADRLRHWSGRLETPADRRILAAIRRREVREAARARTAIRKWWTRSRRRELQRYFRRMLRKGAG